MQYGLEKTIAPDRARVMLDELAPTRSGSVIRINDFAGGHEIRKRRFRRLHAKRRGPGEGVFIGEHPVLAAPRYGPPYDRVGEIQAFVIVDEMMIVPGEGHAIDRVMLLRHSH